jgi:hypothetical protein
MKLPMAPTTFGELFEKADSERSFPVDLGQRSGACTSTGTNFAI